MKIRILAILAGIIFITSCVIYVPVDEGGRYEPPRGRGERYERPDIMYPEETDVSYFYDYLADYGVWVRYSPYGYVWIPRSVRLSWRPYTYGRWVWTSYGWTWLSYEKWGWACYHYGRWGWDRRLGWFWVPGTVWAPAWVTWRWGSLYIGWAPLPPEIEFVPGIGIRPISYDLPHHCWVFVEGRHFQHDYLDRYVLPFERNATVINFTVHKANLAQRNRLIVNDGVDVEQVRLVTKRDVPRYELVDARDPGGSGLSRNGLSVYRPVVKKNEAASPKSVLEREEAEARIPEIRRQSLERQVPEDEIERRLTSEHDREMRLLEETQKAEESEIRRRAEDEKRLASRQAEREKVEKETAVKIEELKKKHQEEKEKIGQRHDEERKTVQGRVKRKGNT